MALAGRAARKAQLLAFRHGQHWRLQTPTVHQVNLAAATASACLGAGRPAGWRALSSQAQLASSPRAPSTGSVPQELFDRRAKRLQRDSAARNPKRADYELLRDEVAWQIADRVADLARDHFASAIDIGCGRGHLGRHLDTDMVGRLFQCEYSAGMLEHFEDDARDRDLRVVCAEDFLPFPANTFDLAVSSLNLHWVNDLPQALREIQRVLKPDAPFIGAMLGGDTLFELRCSLQLAETERLGGFAPRVSPMTDVQGVGSLLTGTGFTLLNVDIDEIIINYPSPLELMNDLRFMGESNAVARRQRYLSRDAMLAAAATYQAMYGNEDGTVPATFQVIHMLGWKPDPSQPKPKRRGTAERSLKELGVDIKELQASLDNDKGPPGSSRD